MDEDGQDRDRSLADLPPDELRRYARDLGLEVRKRTPHADVLRRIRERRELLLELDREAMLDVVVWSRRPVRRSASKEQLAKLIAAIDEAGFDGLSHRGLVALARLRGVDASEDQSDEAIVAMLGRREGLRGVLRRKRRSLVGWAMERVIEGKQSDDREAYQFLPEDAAARESAPRKTREPSLRKEVENRGVVGGLAGKLRTVADDYIAQKLDEIELRIDQKLDEIDARLAEWRDREVANRLRIIKITLLASLVVALLSLGYKYARSQVVPEAPTSRPALGQSAAMTPGEGWTSTPSSSRGLRRIDISTARTRYAEPINQG